MRWLDKVCFHSYEIHIVLFFFESKHMWFESFEATRIFFDENVIWNLFHICMIEFFHVDRSISSWTSSPLDKSKCLRFDIVFILQMHKSSVVYFTESFSDFLKKSHFCFRDFSKIYIVTNRKYKVKMFFEIFSVYRQKIF